MTIETQMQARLALRNRIREMRKNWKLLKKNHASCSNICRDEYVAARKALKEVKALGWT